MNRGNRAGGSAGGSTGSTWHIWGPPGCGKTTHLKRRVDATRKARGEESVCAVAYTRTAATEIASRIGDAGGGKGKNGEDVQKRVGTLHSILYPIVGYPSIAEIKIAGWNASQSEFMQISSKHDLDDLDTPHGKTRGDELMSIIQLNRAKMIPIEMWRPDVRGYYLRWCAWKEKEGHVDFTDFIEIAIARDLPPPEGTSVGICDESQDFSRLEITLIKKWANHWDSTVFAYDDDQALFTWRGADPTALLDEMPAPPDHCKVLDQSYRVPRAVHAAAQTWIERCQRRILKEYKPRPEDGRVRRIPGYTYRRPQTILDLVQEDLAAGGDVMILASCGYMLAPLLAVLRKSGTPFHNPYRKKNGAWNPLSVGATARRILSFSRRCQRLWGEEAILHVWSALELADWTKHLGAGCFAARGKKQELLDMAADKERKKELVNDADFLSEECRAWVDRGDLGAFERAIIGNQRNKYEFPLSIARRNIQLLDTEKNPPRIITGTVHSVKGGEASHVYLFPDLSQAGYAEWSRTDSRDNIRRVFYVGMTRAKETLTLLGPSSSMAVTGM